MHQLYIDNLRKQSRLKKFDWMKTEILPTSVIVPIKIYVRSQLKTFSIVWELFIKLWYKIYAKTDKHKHKSRIYIIIWESNEWTNEWIKIKKKTNLIFCPFKRDGVLNILFSRTLFTFFCFAVPGWRKIKYIVRLVEALNQ
jgi:hypothetical protein